MTAHFAHTSPVGSAEQDTDPQAPQDFGRLVEYLGDELKTRRQDLQLSRADVAAFVPRGFKDHVLYTYEAGVRSMTVLRFVEICAALDASAPGLLAAALARIERQQCPTCGAPR
jgi:hypothetical protein